MSELNHEIRQSPDYVDGGIVWVEEKAVSGAPLLCTQWGGLEARCGQVIMGGEGLFYFAQFGRFESEHAAKMFAEKVLTAHFNEQIEQGEAQPMAGHEHLVLKYREADTKEEQRQKFLTPPTAEEHPCA